MNENLNESKPKKKIPIKIGNKTFYITQDNVPISHEGEADKNVIEEFVKLAKKDIFTTN